MGGRIEAGILQCHPEEETEQVIGEMEDIDTNFVARKL